MFVIGKANEKEIAEMKEMGFKLEDVDPVNFNAALDPAYDPSHDPDLKEEQDDKLVCVFLDCDIVQECRSIHNEEKSLQLKKLQFELSKSRDIKMDDVWHSYDLKMDEIDMEFSDADGWEHDFPSDEYCRNFYATPKVNPDADSTKFHFIIRFKPDTSKVFETIVRDQQGNDITCGGVE